MKTADFIAKTEKLTREVLIREVLPSYNESNFFKEKRKELLSDLGCISSQYDLEERVIIYCFIRLWKEGRVIDSNFWESFNNNRFDMIPIYIKQYYSNLEEDQNKLWED